MKVLLPAIEGAESFIENMQSIILIGANGSGKTRLSIWIEENNKQLKTHRISAQKSLNMPIFSSPSEIENAVERLLYGQNNDNKEWLEMHGKRHGR